MCALYVCSDCFCDNLVLYSIHKTMFSAGQRLLLGVYYTMCFSLEFRGKLCIGFKFNQFRRWNQNRNQSGLILWRARTYQTLRVPTYTTPQRHSNTKGVLNHSKFRSIQLRRGYNQLLNENLMPVRRLRRCSAAFWVLPTRSWARFAFKLQNGLLIKTTLKFISFASLSMRSLILYWITTEYKIWYSFSKKHDYY